MSRPRPRHLRADPEAANGCLEWDPDTRRWHPAGRREHLGDRLMIGFGILVLLYFAGQLVRGLIQHGLLG